MLTPVYFPFTYLGGRAAAALQAHFDSIRVLRPFAESLPPGMQELEDRGFLEILTLPPGDEEASAAALRQLREWARRHAGGAGVTAAFWQARMGGDPMGGDRSAFQLASQITHRPMPGERRAEAGLLLAARVFLSLAQELDWQDDEVLRELARFQTQRAELLAAMTGRPTPASPGRGPAEVLPAATGCEEHRLPERLGAWARLFMARACPSPVLVTTSAAALAHLVEAAAAVRRLPVGEPRRPRPAAPERPGPPTASLIAEIADWVAAPEARIEPLAVAEFGADPVPSRGDPVVYLLPGESPSRLLGRFAAPDPGAKTVDSGDPSWKHTLVVLVPPPGADYGLTD